MNANDFFDIPIETDPATLGDDALAYLETQIPGYVPNPGNLEVITVEAVAPMAADQASVAAQVPLAIFRKYGTDLVGVLYEPGQSASVTVQFNLVDTVGHTIPANTYLTIAGLGFSLLADVVVAAGASTGTGSAVAVDIGTDYNGLSTPVELVSQFDWVVSVAAIGTTSGGLDAELDTDYVVRLKAKLALQAPTVVTADDAAVMARSFAPLAGTVQQQVGRAVGIDLYNPSATVTFTGTVASGSSLVTAVSSTVGIGVGTVLAGAGIPTGAVVLAVAGSTLTMSANATASGTAESITATGTFNNDKSVAVFATQADGTALNPVTLAALAAWLESFREVNFELWALDPTRTPIYVTHSIKVLPNFDPVSTAASSQAAILNYLNPAYWGNPVSGESQPIWVADTAIRYNSLIAVIENVEGVQYCASLFVGTAPAPTGTSDLTLGGPVPLPSSTATTVPLPTVI